MPCRATDPDCQDIAPSHHFQENDCRAAESGKEFTDGLFASRARAPSGAHAFDQLCAELGIAHRLTPTTSHQTNGMAPSHGFQEYRCRATERFNGRISDVLKTNRFASALDLEQTLMG